MRALSLLAIVILIATPVQGKSFEDPFCRGAVSDLALELALDTGTSPSQAVIDALQNAINLCSEANQVPGASVEGASAGCGVGAQGSNGGVGSVDLVISALGFPRAYQNFASSISASRTPSATSGGYVQNVEGHTSAYGFRSNDQGWGVMTIGSVAINGNGSSANTACGTVANDICFASGHAAFTSLEFSVGVRGSYSRC